MTRARASASHITTCSCWRTKSSFSFTSWLGKSSAVTAAGRSCKRASRKYSQSSGQSTVFSRSLPQHEGQISPPTPGQYRLARFFSQILQGTFTGRFSPSYHRKYGAHESLREGGTRSGRQGIARAGRQRNLPGDPQGLQRALGGSVERGREGPFVNYAIMCARRK